MFSLIRQRWFKIPKRLRRFLVLVLAAGAGAALGLACPHLPAPLQAPCHLAAKLLKAGGI